MVSTLQMLVRTEVLTLPEALKVTLIGLLVVFAVLAILILFIELLHTIVTVGEKAGTKTGEKQANVQKASAPVSTDDGKRISAGVMAAVPDAKDAGNDPEFIAAVSTAISVATGRPNGSFTIKSIKESN